MADKLTFTPQCPLHNQTPHSSNQITDPKRLAYLENLTTGALFAAQQRNIIRQHRLARAIEAAALDPSSATELARLQSMWTEVTAQEIVPDDTLIDILSMAALQSGSGGISWLLLNRFLVILHCDFRRAPDRHVQSVPYRATTHTARLMKRIEVLLACGFDKAKLKLAVPGRLHERDEVWQDRHTALTRTIHALNSRAEKTEDAAIELGSALAAWYALRGEVFFDRGSGDGVRSSQSVQIAPEIPSAGSLNPLLNRWFAQQAGLQGLPIESEIPQQAVLQGLQIESDIQSDGNRNPLLNRWFAEQTTLRGPRAQLLLEFPQQQRQLSPAVDQGDAPPAGTRSAVQVRDNDPRTYSDSSILVGSKAKMEQRTDSPVEAYNALPSPSASKSNSKSPQRHVETDPDLSNLVRETERLDLARAGRGQARPVPWNADQKRNGH